MQQGCLSPSFIYIVTLAVSNNMILVSQSLRTQNFIVESNNLQFIQSVSEWDVDSVTALTDLLSSFSEKFIWLIWTNNLRVWLFELFINRTNHNSHSFMMLQSLFVTSCNPQWQHNRNMTSWHYFKIFCLFNSLEVVGYTDTFCLLCYEYCGHTLFTYTVLSLYNREVWIFWCNQ